MLRFLGLFCLISFAESNETTIHAKLLLFSDELGEVLPISGPVSPEVNQTLQRAIQEATQLPYKSTRVAIKPLYNNAKEIPHNFHSDTIEKLKEQYKHIFPIQLHENESGKLISELRRHIFPSGLIPVRRDDEEATTPADEGTTNVNNGNETETTTEKANTNETQILNSPKHYLPNSIYYAIEKKCANWNDDCDDYLPISGLFGHEATKSKVGGNWPAFS